MNLRLSKKASVWIAVFFVAVILQQYATNRTVPYAPMWTPEIEALCEDRLIDFVPEPIVGVEGYVDTVREEGCGGHCQSALMDLGFGYVEIQLKGSGFFGQKQSLRFQLAEKNGWYRFTREQWGHEDCATYQAEITRNISDVEAHVRRNPSLASRYKYCIGVEKIKRPEARYELLKKEHQSRKEVVKLDGGLRLACETTQILDRQSDTVIASSCTSMVGRFRDFHPLRKSVPTTVCTGTSHYDFLASVFSPTLEGHPK